VLIFKPIFASGAKTPAGGRGWGDSAGALFLALRRLTGPHAESEAPAAKINSHV